MKKSERTHELIKESILNILSKKSFNQITVNDICNQSYITRSTFYMHYKDKYHVLESINEDICVQLDKHLSIRFNISDIESLLISLINGIDKNKFLIMIDIQNGSVNLKQDIQDTVQHSAHKYFESVFDTQKCDVNIDFMAKLFSSIAITFLEYSMIHGEIQQNASFLNTLNKLIIDKYIDL
ncbi:TetR/AcrR family transcriptional regulator [Lactococcus lactis]|uniref:TetR/AcrR family transcriptional regulator n=1 Tax=Lactococcus lactis TaxID=1358 RepID=UPI0024A759B8|nr:TetR/AcrR family transcriptional regulator [Lactococcus lactis]